MNKLVDVGVRVVEFKMTFKFFDLYKMDGQKGVERLANHLDFQPNGKSNSTFGDILRCEKFTFLTLHKLKFLKD